jgi:aminoglycoside phosphotransferase (APT) family kinase protein
MLELTEFEKIAQSFGLNPQFLEYKPYGSGLINRTYYLLNKLDNQAFILQKVNHFIFKQPEIIAQNWLQVAHHLHQKFPDYPFQSFVFTQLGQAYYYDDEGSPWRLIPFVPNSFTYDTLHQPQLAQEAARQFAHFSGLLTDLDTSTMAASIPDFHNLSVRYRQFEAAGAATSPSRLAKADKLIEYLLRMQSIEQTFRDLAKNPSIKPRVMHHDTKISNILFAQDTRQFLGIIDLDTLMPGYFISDLGDMLRTCLNPSPEDETDLEKIAPRDDFFRAIMQGYLSEMSPFLSVAEKDLIFYAGEFMIYMQALRFLTDYLNNDPYYQIHYPQQNLHRAINQTQLLKKYIAKKTEYQAIIQQYCL